jgi:hypothetical protein
MTGTVRSAFSKPSRFDVPGQIKSTVLYVSRCAHWALLTGAWVRYLFDECDST